MSLEQKLNSSTKPLVMGIINATPDSFSDGGKHHQLDAALRCAEQMLMAGADILDIGGESTRPGAEFVSEQEELERTIPVIEKIHKYFDTCISIDTYKPAVMMEAVKAGAGMINDVKALQESGAIEAAASTYVPVCMMHMQGSPKTMQDAPSYTNVLDDVKRFFSKRIEQCEAAGIQKSRLILDPGFGFGKTLEHNLSLLANFSQFECFGLPLLAGLSRKSMFGALLNRDVQDRLAGSICGALLAAQNGARIIRVHDVAETVDAMELLLATQQHRL